MCDRSPSLPLNVGVGESRWPVGGLGRGLSRELARTLRVGVLWELPLVRKREDQVDGMEGAHLARRGDWDVYS